MAVLVFNLKVPLENGSAMSNPSGPRKDYSFPVLESNKKA